MWSRVPWILLERWFAEPNDDALAWRTPVTCQSYVVPYLNRLADYIYMLARAAESEWVPSKEQE